MDLFLPQVDQLGLGHQCQIQVAVRLGEEDCRSSAVGFLEADDLGSQGVHQDLPKFLECWGVPGPKSGFVGLGKCLAGRAVDCERVHQDSQGDRSLGLQGRLAKSRSVTYCCLRMVKLESRIAKRCRRDVEKELVQHREGECRLG